MKLVIACAVASAFFSPPSDGYVLPYPKGVTCGLLQGYAGAWGHENARRVSYDFQMPIGSPVVAARSGEVVHLVESNKDSTESLAKRTSWSSNIRTAPSHGYYHLTTDGVLVALGDRISQGQRIALSGDSGASAGAHLHFECDQSLL